MNVPREMHDRESQLFDRLADCFDSSQGIEVDIVEQLVAEFPEFEHELREYYQAQKSLTEVFDSQHDEAGDRDPACTDTVRVEPDMPELDGYDFIREVSRGGMGVVYEVRDRKLNRVVALKTIRAEISSGRDEKELQRFNSETQRVALLDHPHVVPLYEAGAQDGVQFFTMRLMSGGSLADRLRDNKPDMREAAQIVANIASGIHHAHQRGLLHRDIKPGNILFDDHGVAQVADFGLARSIEPTASLHSGAIVGTPMYMAPEQAHGTTLTTTADIYSLGAVLYELLTGRPPHQSDSPLNTLVQLANQDPPCPRTLKSDVDVDLETICLKCLERDPDRRYGSADALADDLQRWLRTEPITARRASTWYRFRKWSERSPAMVAMTGAVAAALMACAGLLVFNHVALQREQVRTNAALKSYKNAKYFQSIALAEHAVASGDIEQARRFLEECPEEERHWEWYHLRSLCRSDVRKQSIEECEFSCFALDAAEQRVVVGGASADGHGAVWVGDASLVTPPTQMHRHSEAVTAIAVSPSGDTIASSDNSGQLHIWQASDPSLQREVLVGANTNALAFSPDESTLAIGDSDHIVRLVDVTNGETLWRSKHDGPVWSISFSRDGRQVASSSSDQTIRLWDAESGEQTRTFSGHRGLVRSVVFSPDSERLLSASYDGTARVWSVATGKEIAQLAGHRSYVTTANFSLDGQRIVTASVDQSIAIWDATTDAKLSLLHGSTSAVWSARFANQDRSVVTLGGNATLRLWNSVANGLSPQIAQGRMVESLVLSDDASQAAVAFEDDNAIEVWNVSSDKKQFEIPRPGLVATRQFSSDGSWLAVSRHQPQVEVYSTSSGELAAEYASKNQSLVCIGQAKIGFQLGENEISIREIADDDGTTIQVEGDIRSLSFSPNDRLLVVTRNLNEREETLLFDVASSALVKTLPHAGHVIFTADSAEMAVLDGSKQLIVLPTPGVGNENANTKTVTVGSAIVGARFLDKSFKHSAAANNERRVCIATIDGRVAVWDVDTGRLISTLSRLEEQLDGFCLNDGSLVGYSRLGLVQRWSAEFRSAEE